MTIIVKQSKMKIKAIYEKGVLRPLEEVGLEEMKEFGGNKNR